MKVKDRIRQLRKLVPKGPSPFGQLYRTDDDLQRSYFRATFWTIFRSDQNTYLVRSHVFYNIAKPVKRTPLEWHAWFSKNLDKIQRETVLTGLNNRTGRKYFIYKKLGWIGHASKLTGTTALGRAWHPPKSKGK